MWKTKPLWIRDAKERVDKLRTQNSYKPVSQHPREPTPKGAKSKVFNFLEAAAVEEGEQDDDYTRWCRRSRDKYSPERVFSSTGILVRPYRSKLSVKTIAASQCLRSWSKEGIVTFQIFEKMKDRLQHIETIQINEKLYSQIPSLLYFTFGNILTPPSVRLS